MFLEKDELFCFYYDGVPAIPEKIKKYEEDGWLNTEYSVGNLTVINSFKKNGDIYEWLNWFENRSSRDTKIISNVYDCNIFIPLKKDILPESRAFLADGDCTLVYSPKGSNWAKDEFTCDVESFVESTNRKAASMFAGSEKYFSAVGGRSSQKFLPMFDINQGNSGYIAAVGWTGQWFCKMSRDEDGMKIQSGIEELSFVLHPGEKIRTSSFVIMPYSNGLIDAHNKWRRFVKSESIIGKDKRDKHAPLAVNLWGGMKSETLVERANFVGMNNMGFEYFWIDAGWHGHSTQDSPNEFESDWWANVGSWNVNPYNHPDGLKEVAKAIKNNGMKFLLWFEPERVRAGSDLERVHSDFLLKNGDDGNFLLYLGNETAWQWCFDMICRTIKELDVKCYRQDFNLDPLPYWRNADEENRKGIHEIKHIMGIYRLWEALLAEFPDIIIDNCASGGRRIDIETLKRSVPLWRSDYQCPANHDIVAAQCHTAALSSWIPYHGTSVGRIVDLYRFRSCYTTALGNGFIFSSTENINNISEEKIEFIRKMNDEYKRIRDMMECDYYPLTSPSANKSDWCVMQFEDSEKGESVILAYRREKSPYTSASFTLGNIQPDCNYEFTDADNGEKKILSGKELIENGFILSMPEKRTARIIFVKKV